MRRASSCKPAAAWYAQRAAPRAGNLLAVAPDSPGGFAREDTEIDGARGPGRPAEMKRGRSDAQRRRHRARHCLLERRTSLRRHDAADVVGLQPVEQLD